MNPSESIIKTNLGHKLISLKTESSVRFIGPLADMFISSKLFKLLTRSEMSASVILMFCNVN